MGANQGATNWSPWPWTRVREGLRCSLRDPLLNHTGLQGIRQRSTGAVWFLQLWPPFAARLRGGVRCEGVEEKEEREFITGGGYDQLTGLEGEGRRRRRRRRKRNEAGLEAGDERARARAPMAPLRWEESPGTGRWDGRVAGRGKVPIDLDRRSRREEEVFGHSQVPSQPRPLTQPVYVPRLMAYDG